MKKLIFWSVFFIVFSVGAKAQSNDQLVFPHWYISLYSGLDSYMTENNIPFKKESDYSLRNAEPLSSIGVGYDITPVWGIRGQLGWAKYVWKKDSVYYNAMGSANVTCDVMFNVVRLIDGYDPDRIFDLQFFVGIGAAYRPQLAFPSAELSPIGRFGFQGNFYLSRHFAINIDLATNFVSGKMNDVEPREKADNFTAINLGFTYHISDCNCSKKPSFQ
jgi:hypothetical protein